MTWETISRALGGFAAGFLLTIAPWLVGPADAKEAKRPNILVIWGDDIGWYTIRAYSQGVMGYPTPNIDRIAREGALFTDWCGRQSCTAGRAALLKGDRS